MKNHLKAKTPANIILKTEQLKNDFEHSYTIKNMNYYCKFCDKTNKSNSKVNHLKTLTHIQYGKSIRRNHFNKNPNFIEIDKFFNDFITNHIRKFELYLHRCEFKLDFNNITPHDMADFYDKTTINNLKRYLLYWIEYFTESGHKFSQIVEMKIKTISVKNNVNYKIILNSLWRRLS